MWLYNLFLSEEELSNMIYDIAQKFMDKPRHVRYNKAWTAQGGGRE